MIILKKGTSKAIPARNRNLDRSRILYQLLYFICFMSNSLPDCSGQATPFKKSVLDSLKANDFNCSFAYAFNLGQDGTSTFTTNADLGMMYSTRRSNYELMGSSYFNRFESTSTANRLYAIARISLFSHDISGDTLKEKKLYPELFSMYVFDANRGINYRWQWGINAVYAFKPKRLFRIKAGLGILYEMENWQMIKKENLYQLDTISAAEKSYLLDTVGINAKGELYRNNFRLNLYTNFIIEFTKNLNLSAYLGIQEPFVPPYHDLPPDPRFPVVTKRYPRITIDTHLTYHIWKVLNLVTDFTLQYDKGQIPLYVPNFVYALTQGFDITF